MNVYFGLGSNLGNRIQNLHDAVVTLCSLGQIIKCSSVYETSPWGGVKQPDYLNACVSLNMNDCSPFELLTRIKTFECELGRVESVRWGPRKIDIDILLIDDLIVHSDALNVPHISIPDRLFVLIPLKDILPEGWRHPESMKTIDEMIEDVKGEEEQTVRKQLSISLSHTETAEH